MENASKALLIAAGMLIALMILVLLVMVYNQISSYYKQNSEITANQQLAEFNKKFENYDGREIRGSDLISIMNMIMDYNHRESEQKWYQEIKLEINIGTKFTKDFIYDRNDANELIPNTGTITNTQIMTNFMNLPSKLIEELQNKGINNVTDTKLQKLSANIANIILTPAEETADDEYSKDKRQKRKQIIKNILGYDIAVNNTYKTVDTEVMEEIQKVTKKYYEYTQFKRAHFICKSATEVSGIGYDKETSRVNKMTFYVVTTGSEDNQSVKFN